MMRLHIGHHFFGAGNVGDDLMLAGFLAALQRRAQSVELTCCIPWDIHAMRRRFPEVTWLPYDIETRRRCVEACDAWLGLGDTPFQTSVGDWLLDHLADEAALCRAAGKRMHYLGVGVNDEAAVTHPKTAALVACAASIHTRDAASARLLAPLASETVRTGSDLAHLYLVEARFAAPDPRSAALVLNFEDPAQYEVAGLARLVDLLATTLHVRWVAQEVRSLAASEVTLHGRLPPSSRAHAALVVPDYAGATTVPALLASFGVPGAMLTSRYHASLVGAWMGSRVVVFPRSLKVGTSADELNLSRIVRMDDVEAIAKALDAAGPVDRAVLLRHAELAQRACDEALDLIASQIAG